MHDRTCQRDRLAAGDFAVVERCHCGAIHLTIGALTLRLQAEALGELATVVGEAARQLALHDLLAARRALWKEMS
jgi:hypothetical protein